MKNIEITYSNVYPETPVTFWVHHRVVSNSDFSIHNFEPPLSGIIGGKGYPLVHIYYSGVELLFSSIKEIEHVVDILSKRNLPTSLSLALKRDARVGSNGHWLSRLPAKIKPWKKRERLLPLFHQAAAELELIYCEKCQKDV